jgi:FtsP/CotA-like multicopper oxidase with cupredoxin domain
VLLDPTTIPQFTDPLPEAGAISVVDATSAGKNGATFTVAAEEFQAQILPAADFGPSWVWGYLVAGDSTATPRPSYLGPVVIAEKGVAAYPKYLNNLPSTTSSVLVNLPIDMTLDWANPLGLVCGKDALGDYIDPACGMIPPYSGPVPIATHLHGGEVSPAFDGGPDAWFTPDGATPDTPEYSGPGFPGKVYTYMNEQQESTIWFHDHALGITRLNVYAGLAGLYPIVDPANPPLAAMPAFPAYDIPLIIQDRSFDVDGEIFYNLASNPQPNPSVHPFWIPEFIGDTIVVNGKTWPFLNVEPRQYRFRYVNGSNSRFYELTFNEVSYNPKGKRKVEKNKLYPQLAIATDDGYLVNATATDMLILGPGERYEVIVDFSGLAPGTEVQMMNSARTPYPAGGAVVAGLTDTVMLFKVVDLNPAVPDTAIAAGTPIRPTPLMPIVNGFDPVNGIKRQLTLNEVIGAGGPLELVVNNTKFNKALATPGCPGGAPMCRETELPAVGDTEIWEIINISADAHPMHTHLTSFQVIDRTPFEATPYINVYDTLLLANGVLPGEGPPNIYNVRNLDGAIGGNPAVSPYLKLDQRTPALPYEMGWKDTVIAYPGEVTRIVVRWATTDAPVDVNLVGTNTYPFDPTVLTGGVGYVWHCHIIDHEDNEMMRNYVVGNARQPVI